MYSQYKVTWLENKVEHSLTFNEFSLAVKSYLDLEDGICMCQGGEASEVKIWGRSQEDSFKKLVG
jgi:hypothetical protein